MHARWGGFIRQRGLMIMALSGNVVTSFSWFGVNMLGIHSYGFMEKAFPWLVGFMISQLVLMCVAAMPLENGAASGQRLLELVAIPGKFRLLRLLVKVILQSKPSLCFGAVRTANKCTTFANACVGNVIAGRDHSSKWRTPYRAGP